MGLLKYGTGDKVLLKATIVSAEVYKSFGKERVMYKINECETPVPEESIVGKIEKGTPDEADRRATKKNKIIPVMIGDKKIEMIII